MRSLAENFPFGSIIKVAFKNLLLPQAHRDAGISAKGKIKSYNYLNLIVIWVEQILEGILKPLQTMTVSLRMKTLAQIKKTK